MKEIVFYIVQSAFQIVLQYDSGKVEYLKDERFGEIIRKIILWPPDSLILLSLYWIDSLLSASVLNTCKGGVLSRWNSEGTVLLEI